jgi:hypothetical protein
MPTHTCVASLEPNQRRHRDAEPLGPGALRFAAAQPRDGEVFAQASQGLSDGWGQRFEGFRALWHNKEFII